MGKASKYRIAILALITVVSLLLLACDSPPIPPAPNQQQNTPTPHR